MKHVIAFVMSAGMAVTGAAHAASLDKADINYIKESGEGLSSELKLGQLAQARAHDARVREFGKQMMEDHGKDLHRLEEIAARKQVHLPHTLNKEQLREQKKLEKLSGKAFDREYVKYEIKDHQDDIKEQNEELKSTRDADLKKFARDELQTVTGHKQKIDTLQALLK